MAVVVLVVVVAGGGGEGTRRVGSCRQRRHTCRDLSSSGTW